MGPNEEKYISEKLREKETEGERVRERRRRRRRKKEIIRVNILSIPAVFLHELTSPLTQTHLSSSLSLMSSSSFS